MRIDLDFVAKLEARIKELEAEVEKLKDRVDELSYQLMDATRDERIDW